MDNQTCLLVNGNIHTLENACPRAEAVAICDGKIVALGKNRDVRGNIPGGALLIDLKGRTVLPGFIDAHTHMLTCGLLKLQADCSARKLGSVDELVAFLGGYEATHSGHGWIRAFGYDETRFQGGRHPKRFDLDTAVPDRPCILSRICSHMGVLNSRAIEVLDLDSKCRNSRLAGFERDADGRLNGIVHEAALQHVLDRLPPFSHAEIDTALDLAQKEFVQQGICSVHDPGSDLVHPREVLSGYQRALAEKRLFVNTYLMCRPWPERSFDAWIAASRQYRRAPAQERALLRFGAVKLFADGSMGGRTAAMENPYAGSPDQCGQLIEPENLAHHINACHREGFQACVHAIGDRAVKFVLASFQNARRQWPQKDPRHRIEHCEICSPETIRALKAENVIPVVQPGFVRAFGTAYIEAVGTERASRILPQAEFLSAGLVVAEASDAPILNPGPLAGIQAAVTRITAEGSPFFTEHAVDRYQAVAGYTRNAAYAAFQEKVTGSIAVGKQGDLVVLAADPFQVPAGSIAKIPVDMTITGGRVVFSSF